MNLRLLTLGRFLFAGVLLWVPWTAIPGDSFRDLARFLFCEAGAAFFGGILAVGGVLIGMRLLRRGEGRIGCFVLAEAGCGGLLLAAPIAFLFSLAGPGFWNLPGLWMLLAFSALRMGLEAWAIRDTLRKEAMGPFISLFMYFFLLLLAAAAFLGWDILVQPLPHPYRFPAHLPAILATGTAKALLALGCWIPLPILLLLAAGPKMEPLVRGLARDFRNGSPARRMRAAAFLLALLWTLPFVMVSGLALVPKAAGLLYRLLLGTSMGEPLGVLTQIVETINAHPLELDRLIHSAGNGAAGT